jgi:phosphoserine phosphatase RsbU/P
MGHGIEASRMANVAGGCYRTMRRSGADLSATLSAIDEVIGTEYGDLRYVTAQLATFDLDTGVLAIVNAGHPPPLWLRPGRAPQAVDCPVTVPAGLGSVPVVAHTTVDHGDSILFRTDGIVDARSPDGEFFGDDRLVALIERLVAADTTPAEVLRRCLHAVVEHQGGRPNDDATVMMLRWAGSARTAT